MSHVTGSPCASPSDRGARVLILGENALRNQLFGLRTVLDLMFEIIGQHMLLEFASLGLQSWGSGGCGKDVALAVLVGLKVESGEDTAR
jgi:hypothetical protein